MRDHGGRAVGAGEELADGEERHEERRARGDGEDDGLGGALRQVVDHAADVGVAVVDQAVHREGEVEGAEGGVEHVAGVEVDVVGQGRVQAALGDVDQLGRDVDGDDLRAALGEFAGHGSGAAAGVEHPRAAQVLRQARQHQRAHLVAALADRLADAGDRLMGRQPLPRLGRGAVEVGLDAVAGEDVVGHSVESQKFEDFAVGQRFAGWSLRRSPPERSRPGACTRRGR